MTWASIIIIGLIKIMIIIFIIVVKVIIMTVIIITNRKPLFSQPLSMAIQKFSCLAALPSRETNFLGAPESSRLRLTYLLALIRASSVSTWQRGSG